MKIPEKAKKRLIEQGYAVNVIFYEENGELVQFGRCGDLTNGFTMVGGIKMKKGDRWTETLDPKNWSIKVEKLK